MKNIVELISYDSCSVMNVLILRLSVKDQSFALKKINFKNVNANRKNFLFSPFWPGINGETQ